VLGFLIRPFAQAPATTPQQLACPGLLLRGAATEPWHFHSQGLKHDGVYSRHRPETTGSRTIIVDKIENPLKTVADNGGAHFGPAFSGLFAPYWRTNARGALVDLT